MMERGTFYVYAHRAPTYGIFYVGKGSGNRLYKTGNRSAFWRRITAKHGFNPVILECCENEEHAFEREAFWISKLKETGLCHANFTMGGDGVRVPRRWWGDKISASLKGVSRAKGADSATFKHFCADADLVRRYVEDRHSALSLGREYGVSTETVINRLKSLGVVTRSTDQHAKALVCTTTGVEYPSISAAAEQLSLHRENIRHVLKGKYRQTGGLSFAWRG